MGAFSPGLAGVVAFETKISEPNADGGYLRYRGIETHRLEGRVGYDSVWGLLVRGDFEKPLALPETRTDLPAWSGNVMSDVQAATAGLTPRLGLQPLSDSSPDAALTDLETVSAAVLGFVAQAGRGSLARVPWSRVQEGASSAERFMIEWRGDPDPTHIAAVESYWITAAEHGANASTFTARVIASTGADVAAAVSGALGSLSGPLHGGAPSRALKLVDTVHADGNAEKQVAHVLNGGGRLMGFGHAVYRAEDPRARILRATAKRLNVPKYEAALAVEDAALSALRERKPDRVLATNVDFWAAVLLDFVSIPEQMLTPLFAAARVAGWSAHIAEQKLSPKIFRPAARYTGPEQVDPATVPGWKTVARRASATQDTTSLTLT